MEMNNLSMPNDRVWSTEIREEYFIGAKFLVRDYIETDEEFYQLLDKMWYCYVMELSEPNFEMYMINNSSKMYDIIKQKDNYININIISEE